MVFSLSLVNPELGENQKLNFKPQYLLLLTILVIDLLQAIARNLFSGKRLGKLPLAYLFLKEKNFSIYTIALIYAGLQLLVNVAILSVF
jgi:hypothetical protein